MKSVEANENAHSGHLIICDTLASKPPNISPRITCACDAYSYCKNSEGKLPQLSYSESQVSVKVINPCKIRVFFIYF